MEMGIGAEEQLTGIVVEEMLDIDQQQRGVVELPDFVQEQLLGKYGGAAAVDGGRDTTGWFCD